VRRTNKRKTYIQRFGATASAAPPVVESQIPIRLKQRILYRESIRKSNTW